MSNVDYDFTTIVRNTKNDNSNIDRMSDMHIWCEDNCKEEFHLRWYGGERLWADFNSEQDAILFALTWK